VILSSSASSYVDVLVIILKNRLVPLLLLSGLLAGDWEPKSSLIAVGSFIKAFALGDPLPERDYISRFCF